MSTFTAKVYLNDADGSFFGFNAVEPAKLYLVATFDLDADDPNGALNKVFRELNVDAPAEPWAKDYRQHLHRSLSVGDAVVLSESAWVCESVGWRSIGSDELRTAIID
jgi:hypothetical protein